MHQSCFCRERQQWYFDREILYEELLTDAARYADLITTTHYGAAERKRTPKRIPFLDKREEHGGLRASKPGVCVGL